MKILFAVVFIMFPCVAKAQSPTLFKGFIGGLHLANDPVAPNTVLDVESGSAVDSAASAWITLPNTSKMTTCVFISGIGNCGMAAGLTVAPNTWYSAFAINLAAGSDVYFDLPKIVPTTPPSGTTAFRHLGWFMTDVNANIIGMVCDGNDDCYWKNFQGNMSTGVYDYKAENPCGTPTAVSGNTPPCFFTVRLPHIPPSKAQAHLKLEVANISIPQSATRWILTDPDTPDTNGMGNCNTEPQSPIVIDCQAYVTTDSQGQIFMQMNSNPAGSGQNGTVFIIDPKGWHYNRQANIQPGPPPAITQPVLLATAGSTPGAYTGYSATLPTGIAGGSLAAVCVGLNMTNTVAVSGITDGANVYARAKQQIVSPNTEVELWYAPNAVARPAGTTLTVNLTGSTGASSGITIVAAQSSGASVVDQTAGNFNGWGTSAPATTSPLAQAVELAIGCSFEVPLSTYSAGAGFTNAGTVTAPSGNGAGWLDYQITSTPSPVTYGPSWAAAGRAGTAIGTFR